MQQYGVQAIPDGGETSISQIPLIRQSWARFVFRFQLEHEILMTNHGDFPSKLLKISISGRTIVRKTSSCICLFSKRGLLAASPEQTPLHCIDVLIPALHPHKGQQMSSNFNIGMDRLMTVIFQIAKIVQILA